MTHERPMAILAAGVVAALLVTGCFETKRPMKYLGDARLQYYKDTATSIEYPNVYHETPEETRFVDPPQRIRHDQPATIRDISLAEAVHLALANSPIIRTNAEFLSPGNRLMTNPNAATNSIYDSAIQETEVFNGIGVPGSRRGLADALSDFDARFSTSMTWQQNERISNNSFQTQGLTPGNTFSEENRVFNSRLEKQLATGGILAMVHNWNFTANNAPEGTRLFGSFYDGLLQAEYRQPLLAGAGTAYTRIAGPVGRQPGTVSGVNRGVLISRIGQDITLADFEVQVRNLVRDVEEVYWDLALAYRTYNAEVIARNNARRLYNISEARLGLPNFTEAEVAQAESSYFDARARASDARAQLYNAEGRLRRLIGLPVSDGEVLRPVDEPSRAEYLPDWYLALAEALTRRTELRRQKWEIKSLELQHQAARSLLKPRLDFVTNYRVNGFGKRLFGERDRDGTSAQGVFGAYETLTQGDQTGWNLGLEFFMPLGFRQAHAQVKNIEFRLIKARKALDMQEHEISHELAHAFRELDHWYETALMYYNSRQSAARRAAALEANLELKPNIVDPLLRAYTSLAQADVAYYRSLLQYNKAVADVHLRKGSLLENNGIQLSESNWDSAAYEDALRRARARSHAFDEERIFTKPSEFVLGYADRLPVDDEPLQPQPERELPPAPAPETPEPMIAAGLSGNAAVSSQRSAVSNRQSAVGSQLSTLNPQPSANPFADDLPVYDIDLPENPTQADDALQSRNIPETEAPAILRQPADRDLPTLQPAAAKQQETKEGNWWTGLQRLDRGGPGERPSQNSTDEDPDEITETSTAESPNTLLRVEALDNPPAKPHKAILRVESLGSSRSAVQNADHSTLSPEALPPETLPRPQPQPQPLPKPSADTSPAEPSPPAPQGRMPIWKSNPERGDDLPNQSGATRQWSVKEQGEEHSASAAEQPATTAIPPRPVETPPTETMQLDTPRRVSGDNAGAQRPQPFGLPTIISPPQVPPRVLRVEKLGTNRPPAQNRTLRVEMLWGSPAGRPNAHDSERQTRIQPDAVHTQRRTATGQRRQKPIKLSSFETAEPKAKPKNSLPTWSAAPPAKKQSAPPTDSTPRWSEK